MGLLTKGLYWGDIRGLIRITGAEALEEFGFTTKPGAEGVVLRKYKYVTTGGVEKTGIFINNYMPRVQPHTPAQVACWTVFGKLSHLVCANRNPFYNIWQPLAEKRHPKKAIWDCEFRGVNVKLVGVPPDWTKMLISNGLLEPTPQVTGVTLSPLGILTITFDSSTYQNGRPTDIVKAGIYDEVANSFEIPQDTQTWRRQDQQYIGTLTGSFTLLNSIVYIYFSRDNLYSPSVSLHG